MQGDTSHTSCRPGPSCGLQLGGSLEGSRAGPERGGREGACWTTGWKIAEVMFCGGWGRGGSGARGVGFGGVVMMVQEARRAEWGDQRFFFCGAVRTILHLRPSLVHLMELSSIL